MRLSVCVLLMVLLLVILSSLTAGPVSVAQMNTLPPDVTASPVTPFVPENMVAVFGLPFADTFDTNRGWLSSGAWNYDEAGGYEGGGWVLDGEPRHVESVLEYTALLNLSGTDATQMAFRQQGNLPTTDLISVEVSLDGGQSWLVADQQIGVETGDEWALRIVDLTRFQGQIVRLRFRVQTGALLVEGDVVEGDYRIDNLTAQFSLLITPEPVTPTGTKYVGVKTLLGLHMINDTKRDEVLRLVRRLAESGHPMGTIKGLNGTESLLNEIESISPQTVTVYRTLFAADEDGMRDCPEIEGTSEEAARIWMDKLRPFWNQVNADYFEYVNECQGPIEWWVYFAIEMMRLANEDGRCLLLFSLSGGTPEIEQYDYFIPAYRYAMDHPCRPGMYHGIALHAYSMQDTLPVSDSGPYLGFRYRLFYNRLLPQLPDATRLPVYLTELGEGGGTFMLWQTFTCEGIIDDMLRYTAELENDPYVKGFHLWSVGEGAKWVDLSPCLDRLGDALIEYYNQ